MAVFDGRLHKNLKQKSLGTSNWPFLFYECNKPILSQPTSIFPPFLGGNGPNLSLGGEFQLWGMAQRAAPARNVGAASSRYSYRPRGSPPDQLQPEGVAYSELSLLVALLALSQRRPKVLCFSMSGQFVRLSRHKRAFFRMRRPLPTLVEQSSKTSRFGGRSPSIFVEIHALCAPFA